MFITAERARRISFSDPTFVVREGLLVSKGNPRQLHSYGEAARQAGVKIAVLSGSVEEDMLQRLGSQQLVTAPDALTGRIAVESGVADGLALSSPTIRWMKLRDQLGKTEAAALAEQSDVPQKGFLGYGAFGFRKEDSQLLSAWNAALRSYIGSPEHKKLVAGFGFTETELPGSVAIPEAFSK